MEQFARASSASRPCRNRHRAGSHRSARRSTAAPSADEVGVQAAKPPTAFFDRGEPLIFAAFHGCPIGRGLIGAGKDAGPAGAGDDRAAVEHQRQQRAHALDTIDHGAGQRLVAIVLGEGDEEIRVLAIYR